MKTCTNKTINYKLGILMSLENAILHSVKGTYGKNTATSAPLIDGTVSSVRRMTAIKTTVTNYCFISHQCSYVSDIILHMNGSVPLKAISCS